MGPEAAVGILNREALAESEDPEDLKSKLVKEYRAKWANPYVAAGRGFIDDVIDPANTRKRVIKGLEMLQNKRDSSPPKKHGNIPL